MTHDTKALRAELDEIGVPYSIGYRIDGKRINEEDTTNIGNVSVEEAYKGVFNIYDVPGYAVAKALQAIHEAIGGAE